MRLALVTQDFPPDVGGTQSYALELARRFAPSCDAFAVVAPRVTGAAEADAALPFPVHRLRATYDTLSVVTLPWLLRHAPRRLDATFHVQWPTALAAVAARALTGWPRRVFVAAHGRELLFNPLGGVPAAAAAYDGLRRALLRRADRLFPVSRYTAGLLRDAGVAPGRIEVVANGTDPARFRPLGRAEARASLGLDGAPTLLTVCRLVPRKGIDTVLAALPQVAAAVPDVTYLVGGSGPDRPRLEALAAQHGVAARTRFVGRIPDEALPWYFAACDVFTMPARLDPPSVEGFGLVFAEANAAGRPAVGARTGGIPDALADGETGLLVPPDDPAALAAALMRLLTDPAAAAAMGRRGRARVLETLTWDHTADRLLRAMRAVAHER